MRHFCGLALVLVCAASAAFANKTTESLDAPTGLVVVWDSATQATADWDDVTSAYINPVKYSVEVIGYFGADCATQSKWLVSSFGADVSTATIDLTACADNICLQDAVAVEVRVKAIDPYSGKGRNVSQSNAFASSVLDIPGDGIDGDCDGAEDAGWYPDTDGDGFGAGEPIYASAQPPGYVDNADDCAPADPDLPTDWYADGDGDGYGAGPSTGFGCSAPNAGDVPRDGDCNDSDNTVYPGAYCVAGGSTSDANCNGLPDDICDPNCDGGSICVPCAVQTCYYDNDHDGLGGEQVPDAPVCASCGPGEVTNGLDCDDNDPDLGAIQSWYLDADGDGYGAGTAVVACTAPSADYVTQGGDCNDHNPNKYPGRGCPL
jgi:hypothetical protein